MTVNLQQLSPMLENTQPKNLRTWSTQGHDRQMSSDPASQDCPDQIGVQTYVRFELLTLWNRSTQVILTHTHTCIDKYIHIYKTHTLYINTLKHIHTNTPAGNRQNSWQQKKHANLYSELLHA